MTDLFETPELIPSNVLSIFDKYDKGDEFTYSELDLILSELNEIGYTFEYYLDAIPFNLRPINP